MNTISHNKQDICDFAYSRISSENFYCDDDFAFLYGPLMCMEPGFEKIADRFANENKVFKVILTAAYLYRKITSSISYKDAKLLIRDFIVSIDDIFDDEIKQALTAYATRYLKTLRTEQRQNYYTESFMTSSAPIVPYNPSYINRKDLIEPCIETIEMIQKNTNEDMDALKNILWKLLLENIDGILYYNNLARVLHKNDNGKYGLLELDPFIYQMDEIPSPIKLYYILGILNYYHIDKTTIDTYLDFFKILKSYNDLDISKIIKESTIDYGIESIHYINDNSIKSISDILNSNKSYLKLKDDLSKMELEYNLDLLDNYAIINTYISFEESADRYFEENVGSYDIIDIAYSDDEKKYYEMHSGKIVAPFVDLRDSKIKFLVLRSNSDTVEVETELYKAIN